jgi:hypothetical protein
VDYDPFSRIAALCLLEIAGDAVDGAGTVCGWSGIAGAGVS